MRVCEALTNVGVCGFNFNLHYELLNTENVTSIQAGVKLQKLLRQ